MNFNRRQILAGIGAGASSIALASPTLAHSGAMDAASLGLSNGDGADQGKTLQAILNKASADRKPVFIEPGTYNVSNITLPEYVNLKGVGGATQLMFAGGDHFVACDNSDYLSIEGIEFNGQGKVQTGSNEGAIQIRNASFLSISNCEISNMGSMGLVVGESKGRIFQNRISNISGEHSLWAVSNDGLEITGNTVLDCANNGIVVTRWEKGSDNTIVSGNRVFNIDAKMGGTGQWGNGINTYQADGVSVTGNHVSNCTLSAIRSNACSNIVMSDNTCLGSGETAIYSEFSFEGAVISSNMIDGAAVGISVANFNEGGRMGAVTGNIIRNIHRHIPYENPGEFYGLGISVEADTVVSGNVIEEVETIGLAMGWGPYLRNVIAKGNVIRKAENGICVSAVEGIGQALISDNLLSSINDHAIAGYEWHKRVTGELGDGVHFDKVYLSGNKLDK